jgi:hypothetical protein
LLWTLALGAFVLRLLFLAFLFGRLLDAEGKRIAERKSIAEGKRIADGKGIAESKMIA